MTQPKDGFANTLWRHWKGTIYEVHFLATCEWDPSKEVVVYRGPDCKAWVRPSDEFLGDAETDGKRVKRFTQVHCPRCREPWLMMSGRSYATCLACDAFLGLEELK